MERKNIRNINTVARRIIIVSFGTSPYNGSDVWACNKWQTASLESIKLRRSLAALLKHVTKE